MQSCSWDHTELSWSSRDLCRTLPAEEALALRQDSRSWQDSLLHCHAHHGLHSLAGRLTCLCALGAAGLGAAPGSTCAQGVGLGRWASDVTKSQWGPSDGLRRAKMEVTWGLARAAYSQQDSLRVGHRLVQEQYAGGWFSGHTCFHRWEPSTLKWKLYFPS